MQFSASKSIKLLEEKITSKFSDTFREFLIYVQIKQLTDFNRGLFISSKRIKDSMFTVFSLFGLHSKVYKI